MQSHCEQNQNEPIVAHAPPIRHRHFPPGRVKSLAPDTIEREQLGEDQPAAAPSLNPWDNER
jgi:hypothetical protein